MTDRSVTRITEPTTLNADELAKAIDYAQLRVENATVPEPYNRWNEHLNALLHEQLQRAIPAYVSQEAALDATAALVGATVKASETTRES
jgi:hypothetical protein